LVWIKNRDQTDSHNLVDTLRGATLEWNSNDSVIESTVAQGVKSFTSTGYVLGTDVTYNTNNEKFIDWVFRAGQKYGFDIVSYEGTGIARTVDHNLGVVPEMWFVKNLDVSKNNPVYHSLANASPETVLTLLDTGGAFAPGATYWNDTAPTTTQFTVGTATQVNENTKDFIAYLWSSVVGFSKVFSYIGNGNADGPYVDCGFRPRWVLIKQVPGTGNFTIQDALRNPYNIVDTFVYANTNEADTTFSAMDITSNGFKIRNSNALYNTSSHVYVGIAYSEQTAKYSNAR